MHRLVFARMKPAKTSTLNILVSFTLLLLASLLQAQPVVTITTTDANAAETWPGQTPDTGAMRLTRTGGKAGPLTVNMRVRGDAVQGVDYRFASTIGSFLTFPAGQSNLDLTITPIDDLVTELTEIVRVEVQDSSGSSPTYLVGGSGRAEVSIADNDDPNTPPRANVSVVALNPTAAEGTNGAPVPGVFRFTRDLNTNVAVTIAYEAGGSATPGVDYAELSGRVVIPAGVEFVDVVVVPVDDAELEGSETVTLTIAPSSCAGIFPPPPECFNIGTPATASLTILDNEIPPPPPTVTLRVAQDPNVFGLPAIANGSFTAASARGYIASYTVRLDGVEKFSGDTDYPSPPDPGTPFQFGFTFTNLASGPHTVQVAAVDDQGLSGTASGTLYIVALQPPRIPATYQVIALDDEAAETLPGDPPNPGKFLFVRSGTPGDLEFAFFTFTGTARQGVDYTISYGPGVYSTNGFTNTVSQEITINPIDDAWLDGTETVKMELCFPILACIEGNCAPIGTSCTGKTPGLNATIYILDNDTTPPPFSVVSLSATDADAEEVSPRSGLPQNPGVFTLTRPAPTTNDLTVNYALSRPASPAVASRIAANGVDYATLSGVVLIPAGATTVEVVVNPIFDTVVEGNETVTLTLLPPATNAPTPYLLDPSGTNTATVVIRDYAPTNIPVVSITANDAQAIEENVYSRTGSFLVARTGSLAADLTVPYAIDGTASNGLDYATLPGVVTIPAGTPSATIIVNPIVDGVTEPIETVGLALQPPAPDVFPPPYLFSAAATLHHMAGLTIRDTALYPGHPFLTKRQRILLRRFPDRHVVVPLPVTVFNDPSLPPPPNAVVITWAIEASPDLVTWTEIGVTSDPEEFVDVTAGDAQKRFYRFRQVPPAEP